MNTLHNQQLKRYSQKLGREMMAEERKLWYEFLKTLPLIVKRQKIIGKYIVDFYIAKARLIIELDGSQHYEEDNAQFDKERDANLRKLGYTVLRYMNLDINRRFKEVCLDIENHLDGIL